ncbi:LexA family protein [Sporomusa ovata]|uniref:LexA family protein n=1 Tax=Sporomusa ovata TaxID=2378 RepID=UPI0015F2E976
MIPVPLVGLVTAGQPILAVENIEETYPLPAELVGSEDNVFMLSVKGESMINAGILDGVYLLVRQQSNASNGDKKRKRERINYDRRCNKRRTS